MKMVKSLILGSAAAIVAMGGAQAADLPVKAKAVEYVRICSLYGAGFFYIPGTDTCIKLGGYLRVETAFNGSVYNGAYATQLGAQNRLSNYYTARSRQDLTVDTRTATEYGVVRTFFDATFSWTSGSYAGNGTGGTVYSGAAQAGGFGGVGNPSDGGIAGGSVGVYQAFIQFAGFTMGKAVSSFDTPWVNYPGNNFDGLVGGSGDVTAVNQLTYTTQFGNGVSASIALEDPTAYHQSNLLNLGAALVTGADFAGGSFGPNALGGTRAPDIVGVLKVDQAWGVFQLSAGAHNNHAAYYGEPRGYGSTRPTSGAGPCRLACRSRTSRRGRVTRSTCRRSTPTVFPSQLPELGWAELRYVRRDEPAGRLSERWPRGCRRRYLRNRDRHCHGSDLGYARCLQPQLRPVLERCDLRCIRPAEVWQWRS